MAKVIIEGKEVKNQKDITAQMMLSYIENNYPQDKKWFKENSVAEMPDITFQEKKDENGNVITKKTKKGKTVAKKEAVQTGKSLKFNISKARKIFCEKYFPELVKKEKTITEMLKDW